MTQNLSFKIGPKFWLLLTYMVHFENLKKNLLKGQTYLLAPFPDFAFRSKENFPGQPILRNEKKKTSTPGQLVTRDLKPGGLLSKK